jgi:hypothetical protein
MVVEREAHMAMEKRQAERRKVSYYLPLTEPGGTRQVGVVMDISLRGFRMDSGEKIPIGQVRRFHINLPDDVAPQSARTLTGCSRWCHPDTLDPSSYTVGYEFVNVSQDNSMFIKRLFESYGTSSGLRREFESDYIWR